MKKILITGGNGYVARSIYSILKDIYDITSISRSDFDLSNREETNKFFEGKQFDVIIHTAIKGGSRIHPDTLDVTHINLSMFYNLLANRDHYVKLINIGSGAEIGYPTSPYGLSKSIISQLVDNECYFYNIRIFGIFDENELDTRFIKSNIKRYINHQPIQIHQNRYMDFFYMNDFINILRFYIDRNHKVEAPPKSMDCSYNYHLSLVNIAEMINNLDNHKVPVNIDDTELAAPYIGEYSIPHIENSDIPIIKYDGLKQGVINVYNKLKNEH
jgi:UDP-glucose 4-epimerase